MLADRLDTRQAAATEALRRPLGKSPAGERDPDADRPQAGWLQSLRPAAHPAIALMPPETA